MAYLVLLALAALDSAGYSIIAPVVPAIGDETGAGPGLIGALVAGLAGAGLWWLDGGRWQRVSDPSMGTAAPVGTLLWVRPADFATLRVGELVTFHPPGRHDVTYTHRVYSRDGDGTVRTKADLDAPDPWRLSKSDIVGKVAMRWWGIGWLVKAAPVLLAGAEVITMLKTQKFEINDSSLQLVTRK